MWLEQSHEPARCRRCDSHVSQGFRRTFGDSENVAHRCLSCDSRPRVQLGSAAGVDVDWPDPAEYPERNRGPEIDQAVQTDGGADGGER